MINLFAVHSVIEDLISIEKRTSEIINLLVKSMPDLKMQGYYSQVNDLNKNLKKSNEIVLGTIIINTSGGTEALINEITKNTSNPVLILADSQKNSFASSLEAYAFLKNDYRVNIFYSDNISERVNAAKSFSIAVNAIQKINEAHFCLIGDPSDWLLTSSNFTGFNLFNTKFTKIGIDKLTSEVERIDSDATGKIVENWKSEYNEILVSNKSLIDSAKVYLALKNVINEFEADVISVRCFDLLEYNYTACMGLSICNDEGITAGCEGDIPATFTMMIAQQLSGQPVWMANPSSIDKEKNQIIFAHCTVPSKFLYSTKEAGLTTHMESGKSTAIRGPLNKSEVTILRIGDDFKKIVSVKGKIIESDMKNENLCRTQAVIQIEGSVEEWVESSLGNHQIIVYGDITPELKYFCDFSGVEFLK